MKRLLSTVTLCVLTLAASAVFQSVQADLVKVPTLNIRAISGDADIDNQSTYVMAVNFWNQRGGEVINVNGVDFTTVANTNTYTANGVTLTYGSNTTGSIQYNGGNSSNIGSGQLAEVMKGMIFNDGQGPNGSVEMSFTGLTPGQDYTYTVYGRVWGGNDNRRHSYSFFSSGNDTPDQFVKTYDSQNNLVTGYAMSEDNPVAYWPSLNNGTPYLVEYTFTAPENGTFKIHDIGTENNNSWHLYGISLKQSTLGQTDVPVSTDIVKNGGFEIDTFVSTADKHGYVSKNFPLTNWTSNIPGRVGLAPDWSDYNRTSQTCKDFINATQATNAYLPDGSQQALYLQMEGGVSQNITLEPNTDYVLSYYTSSRTGTKDPKYAVDVDGSNVYTGILRVNQFDKNKFTYNAIPFTSQAGDSSYETTLAFTGLLYSDADGSQDRSLLLDNVQIVKASEYVAPTIEGSKHDPTVNGWQANRWNSQATAYLSGKASDYSHAISLGDSSSTVRPMTTAEGETLNFQGGMVPTAGVGALSYQYPTGNATLVGWGNHNGGFISTLYTDDNSKNLAEWTTCSMDRITLNGLEPGATYETLVYFRSYGSSTRTGYLTINGEKSPKIDVVGMANADGGGLVVTYTGTATDSGVINIQIENLNTDTFHMAAVANRYVSAAETTYNIPLQARFNKNDGSSVYGTTPEIALGQLASKSWVKRGNNQALVNDSFDAKMSFNSGAAIDYKFTGERASATEEEILGANYGASKVTLSADLRVGTTGGTYSDNARGVGLGFFDSKAGSTVGGEIGRGFAGLVLDANGNLYYFDKSDDQNSGHVQAVAWGTDKSNGGGAWNKDAWTNVAIDLELIDDGLKAKITDVHVVGSSADYSALIGKVFNTTDMIGFTASSTSTGTNGYVDNVQLIVRETATPETWNQKHEQYKADYIEAAGSDLATATSFRGENGTVVAGTTMDIIDTKSNNVWQRRGMGSGYWNLDGSHSGNPQFTIIENQAKGSANSGIALDWDKAEVNSMTLSVDLQMNTLSGSDYNQSARGLGMGFFDADFGATEGEEVAHGFSGIAVNPSGALYYYESTPDGYTMSTPIAFGGSFDKNEWYTLTMNLDFFQEDGKLMATLTDVSLSGSTADYSDLIGSVFSTTDLIGLLSSSATSWDYYGVFDNFSMSKTVPEPSTWALLILGAAGLLYMRKRGKN
ncbi:MAG: PEP-CTERM sorting domain-containing protein [Thermoguttaceae bacterium]|nr:PEP-CTERM sorting domain-containing protein [Thermoguttaceae bacterium]